MVILELADKVGGWKAPGKIYIHLVFTACIVVAMFLTWRDVYHENQRLSGEIQTLQAKAGVKGAEIATLTLLSIDCSPVSLPVPGRHPDSIFAVYLHPKWGNQLVTFLYGSTQEAMYWPSYIARGIAHRCKIINIGSSRLSGINLILRISYGKDGVGQPSRTGEYRIKDLSPKDSLDIYVTNDTVWSPEVTISELAQGHISGDSKMIAIPIEAQTKGMRYWGKQ